MQPRVMNHCRIPSENRRFYRRMPSVGETAAERDLNDVFEIEFDFIGRQRIRESIERLLRLCLKIFQNGDHSLKRRLVYHTVRSVDKQTNVFVKLNVWRKFHRSPGF